MEQNSFRKKINNEIEKATNVYRIILQTFVLLAVGCIWAVTPHCSTGIADVENCIVQHSWRRWTDSAVVRALMCNTRGPG